MRFEQFGDELAVASSAAELLVDVVRQRRDARVIVPAGRTPVALFAAIVERARTRELDLSRVRFFQLDEYVGVGPKDPRSFHAFLREHLLDPLRRAGDQDFLLDGAAKDPRAEIERHAARLAQAGGADLVFLGIGRNGHVGFNEPGTPADQGARVVELAEQTRQHAAAAAGSNGSRGRSPTRGMTLGLQEIRKARRVALLATGAAKAGIVAALFDELPTTQRPASLLLDHPGFVVFADVAAAARLHGGAARSSWSRRARQNQGRGATVRG
jgi:glucosamine-6-phosphate deaminase